MSQPDFRQDKPYRRGLILGLTMAEVMILLIFVLLMALASALANRDERIAALDQGGASRLIEALQRAYPQARSSDDYFKELVRAIEARRTVESAVPAEARQHLLADAELGRQAREAAARAGAEDPAQFARTAMERASRGSRRGEWPPFFSLSEAGGYYFDSGKATLRPDADAVIERVHALLQADPALKLSIEGHTDDVGSDAANLKLSTARAAAVVTALVKRGIAAERLTSGGHGEAKPLADNATSSGRAKNRRVELVKR